MKTSKLVYYLSIIILSITNLYSQNDISVINKDEGIPLEYPWAGGMNSMQFGEIDLDLDGKKDLVGLDRDGVFNIMSLDYKGNRISCFLNKGVTNEINYQYSNIYDNLFPELYNWAVFVDYNMDGKTDIFTYSPGWAGMVVYKNVSEELLKFELVVSPYLTSFQGGGYTNILVTYADYPGIYDIDNDGDMDILTFSPLGTFVDMHKNLSMETYGTADSLIFERTTKCWGYFAENDESNHLYLDTCTNENSRDINKERHTGSTFLLLDLDADDDADLLLSDIDFPNLIALTNGGTTEEAYITSYDTLFPRESATASLFSMPVASYIDVNNDNVKDLIVSTFDPAINKSKNTTSVWLYLNNGQSNNPNFDLITEDFLQSEMLDFGSGAYPTVIDWDGDGLKDIIVGNYGYYQSSYYDEAHFLHSIYRSRIDLYKNVGTANNPMFKLWIKNLGNLFEENLLALSPAIGDLNDDGLLDILTGYKDGKLAFSRNLGNGNFEVDDLNYFNIDVDDYSYPQLFDLDKDGLLDLIIGEKKGNINYYHNQGSQSNPDFIFVTDSLGKVNVTDYGLSYSGYSTPYFFNLTDGTTKLVVGSEQGQIYYYEDIDGNLDGKFTQSENLNQLLDTTDISFDRGIRTAAALAYFGSDDRIQMLAGNYAGGLEFYNSSAEVLPGWTENKIDRDNVQIYPNPSKGSLVVKTKNSEQILQIKIYTIRGELIKSLVPIDSNSEKVIDLPIENGIYIFEIQTETSLVRKKVLVLQ